MKSLLSSILLVLACFGAASAMTLEEAYAEINNLPDLKGVNNIDQRSLFGAWISSLPIDDVRVTSKVHEVGNGQTVYYGSKVEEVARQLPDEDMILEGADYSSLIYFYARPSGKFDSELLILVDQAYQGKTTAIYGRINNQILKALRSGEVKFTPDHKIIVNVPIMVCD